MTSSPQQRSASGARQGGDDYQHLVAWRSVLRATLPDRQLQAVGFELPGAGNVDDVVLHYADRPSEYAQVRYAVDIASPLNSDYLFRAAPRGTSMLQKFYASYTTLRPSRSGMGLITNRAADPADPALQTLDGRTGQLLPALRDAAPGSAAGRQRRAWAEHIGCREPGLLDMLACLRFQVGRPFSAEEEVAGALMAAAGMRSDAAAVRSGIDLVRQWVLDGIRELTGPQVRAQVEGLGLQVAEPAAILHIDALTRDPSAAEATVALDWLDLFEGDTPAARRRTIDRDAFSLTMHPQLLNAATQLLDGGHHRIVVRGTFRLATAFAIGAALPRVRQTELLRRQGPDLWSTAEAPTTAALNVARVDAGGRSNVALVLGLANDPTRDVAAHLSGPAVTPADVQTIYTVAPAGSASDTSVSGAGHAIAIAEQVRDIARDIMRDHPRSVLHLFLACPGGMALFLGHRWNRVPTTVVYEDLSPGYTPAFTIPG